MQHDKFGNHRCPPSRTQGSCMICKYIGTKFLKMFCAVRFLKVSCFYGFVIILIFPIVCNMTSLAVIGARPQTPPSPQGCPPPAILDKRCLRRFFRSGSRCQQNVATYPGGQRRNKDRAAKKDTEKNRKTYKSRRSASKRFLEWNWLQI